MKKLNGMLMAVILTTLLAFPCATAQAASTACGDYESITLDMTDDSTPRLSDVFASFPTFDDPSLVLDDFLLSSDDKYHICFEYILDLSEQDSDGAVINIPSGINKDIYIHHIRLDGSRLGDAFALTISNSGTSKVILSDVTIADFVNGISVVGSGPVEIRDSRLTRRELGQGEANSGACIETNSDYAVVDNVYMEDCFDGVSVKSRNVTVKNSHFYYTSNGVHVASQYGPVFVEGDKFDHIRLYDGVQHEYQNWIRFDGGTARALSFAKETIDSVRHIYATLPEAPVSGAKLELLTEDGVPCADSAEVCNVFQGGIFELTDAIVLAGERTFYLPEAAVGKTFAGIYTSPTLGSSMSSPAIYASSGIVTFVEAPYDIPTSPVSQDPKGDGIGGGGGGGDAGTGAGGEEGIGMSAAAGCSMLNSGAQKTSLFLVPWWILFLGAVLMPVRVFVRHKNKK